MDEDQHEYGLGFAKTSMKNWRSRYMRTNSRYTAVIYLRCAHGGPEVFWKYFIELWVNGKLFEQTRIFKEAYDSLVLPFENIPSAHSQYTGIKITTIEKFEPKKNDQAK